VDLGKASSVDLPAGDHFLLVQADNGYPEIPKPVTFEAPAGTEVFIRGDGDADGTFFRIAAKEKLPTGKDPWPRPPMHAIERRLATEPAPTRDWYEYELRDHLPAHGRDFDAVLGVKTRERIEIDVRWSHLRNGRLHVVRYPALAKVETQEIGSTKVVLDSGDHFLLVSADAAEAGWKVGFTVPAGAECFVRSAHAVDAPDTHDRDDGIFYQATGAELVTGDDAWPTPPPSSTRPLRGDPSEAWYRSQLADLPLHDR
jgi:hypothetical protein